MLSTKPKLPAAQWLINTVLEYSTVTDHKLRILKPEFHMKVIGFGFVFIDPFIHKWSFKNSIFYFTEESVFSVHGVKLWPDEKRALSFKGNFQRNHRRNFQWNYDRLKRHFIFKKLNCVSRIRTLVKLKFGRKDVIPPTDSKQNDACIISGQKWLEITIST